MPHIHQKRRAFTVFQRDSFKIALLFLMLALLASCQVKAQDVRWLTDRGAYESFEQDGLRLTMSSPHFSYFSGETVTFSVVLENMTAKSVLLKSMTTTDYAFDIEVAGRLWLSSVYSELQVFERELAPGEKIEINYGFVPSPTERGGNITAYFSYSNNGGISGASHVMSLSYGTLP